MVKVWQFRGELSDALAYGNTGYKRFVPFTGQLCRSGKLESDMYVTVQLRTQKVQMSKWLTWWAKVCLMSRHWIAISVFWHRSSELSWINIMFCIVLCNLLRAVAWGLMIVYVLLPIDSIGSNCHWDRDCIFRNSDFIVKFGLCKGILSVQPCVWTDRTHSLVIKKA